MPGVCLVLIVKNEANVIGRCLLSAKLAGVTSYCIVDTGSTDDTMDRIRKFDLPGVLEEQIWVNFALNRNAALDLAREHSQADWFLLMDADDTISGHLTIPGFDQGLVQYRYGNLMYRRAMLVRTDKPWYYVGALHEYLTCDEPFTKGYVEGFTVNHGGDGGAKRNLGDDLKLLLDEHQRNPSDPRTVFYLAQTYKDLGQIHQAAEWYQKRSVMGSFAEEVFYSLYQAGNLLANSDWPKGQTLLLQAWEMRPVRAEPLHALAWHHRLRGEPYLSLLYSEYALHIKEPEDILFIHKDVYTYGVILEHSIALANTGQYALAQYYNDKLRHMPIPVDIRKMVDHNWDWCHSQLAA